RRHVRLGPVEDFFDFPSQTVGFVQAADFWIAEARAQQATELAVAVEALIIHFDDEDSSEAGKNIFQPWRQRIEMFDVQRGNTVAGGAGAVHSFLNRPLSGAPA